MDNELEILLEELEEASTGLIKEIQEDLKEILEETSRDTLLE